MDATTVIAPKHRSISTRVSTQWTSFISNHSFTYLVPALSALQVLPYILLLIANIKILSVISKIIFKNVMKMNIIRNFPEGKPLNHSYLRYLFRYAFSLSMTVCFFSPLSGRKGFTGGRILAIPVPVSVTKPSEKALTQTQHCLLFLFYYDF